MDQQFQLQQSTKQITQQTTRSINQYHQYINMALKIENCEGQQLQFYYQILTNQHNKVQIDMLKIYQILAEQELYQIKAIIQSLMQLVKQVKLILKPKQNKFQKQEPTKIKNENYCFGCKKSIERMKLIKIKQNYGITEGQITQIQTNTDKIDIKQQLKDDGYLQRQKMHIDNLDFHISQLLILLQKQFQSKTAIFLGRDDEIFRKKQMEFTEQTAVMKQNQKQFYQTEQYKTRFNQNFMKYLRLPIQQTVNKMLKNIERKRRVKQKQVLTQSGVQTIFSTEQQLNINLQSQIFNLRTQIKKLKSSKIESEKNILKYLQNQNQLKRQIAIYQQEKIILSQKLKIFNEKSSANQFKLNYQINSKTKQIVQLESQIIQLKNKVHQLQKIKADAYNSKQTVSSIKEKKPLVSRRSIQRGSKKNINPRPSLDMNIALSQTQSFTSKNNSRFQAAKKHTSYIKKACISSQQSEKQYKKLDKSQKSQKLQLIDDNNSQSQISSDSQEQKKQILKISCQVNITITGENNKISGQNQNRKQMSILQKKVKAIRLFKINKKQNLNYTQNALNRTSYQTEMDSNTQKQSNNLTQDFLNDRTSIYNNRTRTQMIQARSQTKTAISFNRSVQKLKSGVVIVRNLKNKNQQNNSQYKQAEILNLSQIKPEHLHLFGGDKYAAQFEKGSGIWPHLVLVDKLVVDFQNVNLSNQIQKYFKYLQQNNHSKFVQYLSFLSQPLSFLQAKRRDQRLDTAEPTSVGIKDLFVRLIRFHKVMHKNCNHINQFLSVIGFKSCQNY